MSDHGLLRLNEEFFQDDLSENPPDLFDQDSSSGAANPDASLSHLKHILNNSLKSLDQLRPPAGVATGLAALDDFLLWRGFPKGDLTLLQGPSGMGATSLWLHAAARLHQNQRWAAWINSDQELLPNSLTQYGVQLQHLMVVRQPETSQQLFSVLQEMISSGLFDLIGCHLPEFPLKNHQLVKLKNLARAHQVALVFITRLAERVVPSLFSLIIDCQRDFLTIRRALHRPTPLTLDGGSLHAHFMSQITNIPKLQLC